VSPAAAEDHRRGHPALSIESRVALTLRCLGGLSTDQIAHALLIGEPAAAQRIVCTKKALRDKSVVFESPSQEQIRERLPGVLQVVYVIFNEGYAASSGPQWIRSSVCEDALRLARVLAGVLPDMTFVIRNRVHRPLARGPARCHCCAHCFHV
jgi:predicted RNA polymerase sigma factor